MSWVCILELITTTRPPAIRDRSLKSSRAMNVPTPGLTSSATFPVGKGSPRAHLYRMASQAAAWLECPLIWPWSWRFNSVSNTDVEVNCSRRIQNAFFYPTLPYYSKHFPGNNNKQTNKKMSISVILSKKHMHSSNLQQNSTKAYKWKK